MAAKEEDRITSKQRFTNTRRVGPRGAAEFGYLKEWRSARRGLTDDYPANEDVKVVEVDAVQGGEVVKVLAYADQVEDYQRALEAHEAKQAEEEEGSDDEAR